MYFIHETLRPHQRETLERIRNSNKKFIILQAPTGSGKSFFPAQLAAWNRRVIALVKTKSLQQQYHLNYGFHTLFGKGNYECKGDNQLEMFTIDKMTADLCTSDNYQWCASNCPYPYHKQEFLYSNNGTLNYSKFLLDRPLVEKFEPEYLFLDEAHELSDLVVDFSGIVLNWSSKRLKEYTQEVVIDTPQPVAIREGRDFLYRLMQSLNSYEPLHPSRGGDVRQYKWWERLKEKVDITLAALDIAPECWYVYANDKHFVCKPLTARFHFQRLFDRAEKIVLMSATIGNIEYFSRELGLENFEFIRVPNVWPAPLRPIVDLKAPKLGFRSPKEDWLLHSQLIADQINERPGHWTGLVHSPSKWLARDIAYNLGRMTGRDIFLPEDGMGTEEIADQWAKHVDNGSICVSWSLWEGIDAGKDNINIVAKVPFINFGDEFDKARFTFDGKSGYQRVANKMVQGLGRIRRGKAEHYGNGKVVAIADGNWRRLRNYIGQDVLDAIG